MNAVLDHAALALVVAIALVASAMITVGETLVKLVEQPQPSDPRQRSALR